MQPYHDAYDAMIEQQDEYKEESGYKPNAYISHAHKIPTVSRFRRHIMKRTDLIEDIHTMAREAITYEETIAELREHIGAEPTTADSLNIEPMFTVEKVIVSDDPTLIQCNVCGKERMCDVVWGDNGDILTACQPCQDGIEPIVVNYDDDSKPTY